MAYHDRPGPEGTEQLRQALASAEAVVLGAGAGLSTAAGCSYGGERFRRYFADFEEKYGVRDMYSGGFYPYPDKTVFWAFFSRNIWINRYMDPPKPVYAQLLSLVKDKDHFVLTTNVDHCFQRAGFPKERLFYTQGDYGLWQCAVPCHALTYDNEAPVREMLLAQGFSFGPGGELLPPEKGALKTEIPPELLPRCPRCGGPMDMNLRCDDRFVEDAGWDAAAERYAAFLRRCGDRRVLYLELGVGYNTPGIIKYPFRRMAARNPRAIYACVNLGEASAPAELADRSVCIDGDIGEVLAALTAFAE